MHVSPTHSVYLHVLNRIPWRYLYVPGVYLLLFSAFTFIVGLQIMRLPGDNSWLTYISNLIVCVPVAFLFQSSLAFLIAWYGLGDILVPDPHETQPNLTETGIEDENFLRKVIAFVPWSYAHIPGVAMFVLTFPIIAHTMHLHRMWSESADWGTALSLRFYLAIAMVLNVLGLALSMGWYGFRNLDIKGANGAQQEYQGSSGGKASRMEKPLP